MNLRNLIKEFFYGGNTKLGKAGRLTGWSLNKAFHFSVLAILAMSLYVTGQFSQLIVDSIDNRNMALTEWVIENPDKGEIAAKFHETCIDQENNEDMKVGYNFIACAESVGAKEIGIAIVEIDKQNSPVAWPLDVLMKALQK